MYYLTTFIDDLAGSHELKMGGELQIAKVRWVIETDDSGYVLMAPEYFGGNNVYLAYNFNGGFDRLEEMWNYSFFVK